MHNAFSEEHAVHLLSETDATLIKKKGWDAV